MIVSMLQLLSVWTIHSSQRYILQWLILSYNIPLVFSMTNSNFQNFRKAIQNNWRKEVHHMNKLNTYENSDCAEVIYPKDLVGWRVTPDCCPCKVRYWWFWFWWGDLLFSCQISKKDVDYKGNCVDSKDDYPPRIIFNVAPTVDAAAPCECEFKLIGMKEELTFPITLSCTQRNGNLT